MIPEIHLHQGDLPDSVIFSQSVAIDTEAMGLNPHRDRLCLVQLSFGDGVCHLVQIPKKPVYAPNLIRLLTNPEIVKIFHYARFDVGILQHSFDITVSPVYCTKVASKLVRNFVERHGLKDLCRDLLGVEISKEQQGSDWGRHELTREQLRYAANDVLYLHQLREKLDVLLEREGRREIAQKIYDFIPTCARLDLLGYEELQVLRH